MRLTLALQVSPITGEAHSHITGEPTANVAPSAVPTQVFLSSCLPINSRISAKLKEKIWSEEYIDFGVLLSNPVTDKYQISLHNSDTRLLASLCLEPVSKPKRILNIEAWQQAFYIFVGVYAQKYLHEAPALMKYEHTICDLAALGQNWLFYNENFRYLRQTQIGSLPWGTVHGELWLHSQYAHKATPPIQNQSNSRPGLPSIPSGFCFKFHHGQFFPVIAVFTIHVLNARVHTAILNVLFVPPPPPQSINTSSLTAQLNSLPTPVKLPPLVEFLSACDPDIVRIQISGFWQGFPIDFDKT